MMFEIGFTRIKERSGRLIFQNTSLLLTLKRNPNTAVQNREKVCDRSDDMETTIQRSQRQRSLIKKKFYLSDRYCCDRWRVVSI